MRLLTLALERYGPFTDRMVHFRPDARLHVVLGANEAGKSSALAAVTDLLFGIETRTRYAFLHEMPQMRIGAEIVATDGRRVAFRRRKGNRNTLVDAADAALPDDTLTPFLGGLSRDVFCRAFGLDAGALRAGAEEMLDAEGELGASLFAAASGLRGYRNLQGRLDEEAAGIFMPRAAQHRTFYQALARHEEARKAIRQSELRAGDWRDLNAEIDGSATRLDEIKAARERIGQERARLARLKRVGPLLAAIDAARGRADADRDLVEVPEPWIDGLGERVATLASASTDAERTALALADAVRDVAAVPSEDTLPVRAEDILEAFRGIARFEKDSLDLPRIQAEAEGIAHELQRLAARIGLPDVAAVRARQPSDAARTRIEGLTRAGRAAALDVARLTQDLATRRADHVRLAAGQDQTAPALDPGPLRADLKSFASLHGDVARREELDRTVKREAGLLWLQAARLSPAIPDLGILAQSGLPSAETIARHRRDLDALERQRDRAADRSEAAQRLIAETTLRLRQREAGRPIPSRADLAALRSARDGLLDPLRRDESEAAWSAYRAALAAADLAADELVSDAARAAEQAADLARLAAEEADAAAALAHLAEIHRQIDAAAEAWKSAWTGTEIAPSSPTEMAAWLTEVETLLEAQLGIETQSIEHARLCERVETFRRPLAELNARAGLPDLDGLDLGLALTRLEERVASLAAAWDAAREAQARVRAAVEEGTRVAAELDGARARDAAWRQAWIGALPGIGLGPDSGIEEAESALEAWRGVPGVLGELDRQERRIAGLRRDIDAYRGAADALVTRLAPDLATLAPGAAMKALHGRLQDSLKAETRRAELVRRQQGAEQAQDMALRAGDRALAGLAAHFAEIPSLREFAADPADLHARLVARRILRDEVAKRRAELLRAADGIAEAELRADLSALTADEIDGALRRLALEEEELTQRGNTAFADRDRGERRRVELESGIGAELALAQRKAAEAELQGAARQWAVLKLASLLIGTAIGRQRAGQQDPLLARAGGLFAGLTGDAFSGLTQDYDDADTPRLAGRRASGEIVHVEGLSEGTRDQLYLALRLAYLEDYAARSEPAPFIGDDLFLTFDDARTGHGIEALAAIGATVQPILFTHHRHVAEIARDRLGQAVDVLEL